MSSSALSMRASAPLLAVIACACAAAPGVRRDAAAPGPSPAGPSPALPGERVVAIDLDGRSRPQVWRFVRTGPDGREAATREEEDLDGDGRVDCWKRYAPDGSLAEAAYDMDLDGKPDATFRLDAGVLARKEIAIGRARVVSTYARGALVRKERDWDGDGKVDAWEIWEGGHLVRSGSGEAPAGGVPAPAAGR